MKSVLISIQPKWVNEIASGKKTIEVRKSKPKLETPFKCYIYETTAKYKTRLLGLNCTCQGKGRVIGEFVCDKIDNYECELWNDEAYELIRQFNYDEYGEIEYEHGAENNENCEMLNKACLTWQDIRKYLGQGLNNCYAWHISDLKIYDKPKELSEFYTFESNIKCEHQKNYYIYPFCEKTNKDKLCRDIKDCPRKRKQLTRPPQSWCYVESGVQCE